MPALPSHRFLWILCTGCLLILFALWMPLVVIESHGTISPTQSQISNLKTAIDAFEVDTGRHPTNAEAFSVLVTPPPNTPDWHGPYIESIHEDPWGHPLHYRYPGLHNPLSYDLSSDGPDGKPNTPDDLTNFPIHP